MAGASPFHYSRLSLIGASLVLACIVPLHCTYSLEVPSSNFRPSNADERVISRSNQDAMQVVKSPSWRDIINGRKARNEFNSERNLAESSSSPTDGETTENVVSSNEPRRTRNARIIDRPGKTKTRAYLSFHAPPLQPFGGFPVSTLPEHPASQPIHDLKMAETESQESRFKFHNGGFDTSDATINIFFYENPASQMSVRKPKRFTPIEDRSISYRNPHPTVATAASNSYVLYNNLGHGIDKKRFDIGPVPDRKFVKRPNISRGQLVFSRQVKGFSPALQQLVSNEENVRRSTLLHQKTLDVTDDGSVVSRHGFRKSDKIPVPVRINPSTFFPNRVPASFTPSVYPLQSSPRPLSLGGPTSFVSNNLFFDTPTTRPSFNPLDLGRPNINEVENGRDYSNGVSSSMCSLCEIYNSYDGSCTLDPCCPLQLLGLKGFTC